MEVKNKKLLEFLYILIFASVSSLVILRYSIFSNGFIVVRDTTPIFYSSSLAKQLIFGNASDLISYLDTSSYPITLLFFLKLISYQIEEKMQYLFFPFIVGQISFYYSIKYFFKKYKFQERFGTKFQKLIPILFAIFAFSYVTNPASAYFSFWQQNSSFVAFSPILLAATDYSFSHFFATKYDFYIKKALPVALICILSSADPRTLVYSILLVLIVGIYYFIFQKDLRIQNILAFLLIFFLIFLIDIRVFAVIYTSHSYLTSVSQAIGSQQSWAIDYFFPFLNSMNNTALYWPWVIYDRFTVFSYFPAFFLILFTFSKRSKGILRFLSLFYLILILFISNVFSFGIFIGDLLIKLVPNYTFIFFPMYAVEILIPISFLISSLGIFYVLERIHEHLPKSQFKLKVDKFIFFRKKSKLFALFIVFFMIASQFLFFAPTYESGSYGGLYSPISPPKALDAAGLKLLNSTGYNLIVGPRFGYPPPSSVWNTDREAIQLLASYKNSIGGTVSQLNSPNLAKDLVMEGVQNIVIDNIYGNFNSTIQNLSRDSGLKEEFNQGYITIFTNLYYHHIRHENGIFLDYGYPTSNFIIENSNFTPINIPYYGQKIPINYVSGIMGVNVSLTDVQSLIYQNFSINLLNLSKRYTPNPTTSGNSWGYSISYYPIGAPGITISGKNNETLSYHINRGSYRVIIAGFNINRYASLTVSNGFGTNLTENFSYNNLPTLNLKWVNYGTISTNGQLYFTNHGGLYITSIELVPIADYLNNQSYMHNYANKISILSIQNYSDNNLMDNYSVQLNSGSIMFKYLLTQNRSYQGDPVTLIVHPNYNSFGVSSQIMRSNNHILTAYYSTTVYYYIVLGKSYNFYTVGKINDTFIALLNSTTISIVIGVAIWLRYSKKLKNLQTIKP